MFDKLWNLPTKGRFSDLNDEVRYLGEMVAAQDNKEASTGVIGTTEWNRIRYAQDRLDEIMVAGDDPDHVYAQYADGYDETIDFSLNAEWRHTAPPADDDAFPF